MTAEFEIEKNRKAFIYTVFICIGLLLLFFIIRWKTIPPPEPIIQDLMEINLGNNMDGFGDVQPLVKGDRGVSKQEMIRQRPTPVQTEKVITEEDGDGVEVNKVIKAPKKTTIVPVTPPVKPVQKPKSTYNSPTGPGSGNADRDNGYKNQGKNNKGPGDNGDPKGNPDSYGNTAGGAIGGPQVIRGNRNIINHYSFNSDLKKATIYARIRVAPNGTGTYLESVKPSTNYSQAYAAEIKKFLPNIKFDKTNDESIVTVKFNFLEN